MVKAIVVYRCSDASLSDHLINDNSLFSTEVHWEIFGVVLGAFPRSLLDVIVDIITERVYVMRLPTAFLFERAMMICSEKVEFIDGGLS